MRDVNDRKERLTQDGSLNNGEVTHMGTIGERAQGQHYTYTRKKNVSCKDFWSRSKAIAVCMMAMLLFLSVEQSQAAEKYVTIVNSPEVKQKLQQASPAEHKRMEKAIKNGNRFIQLRFNDEDTYFYDDPDGDEVWKKKMAPIMSMSMEKWQDYRDTRWEKISDISKTSSGYQLISCPIIVLKDLNIDNSNTILTYRATLIGKFPSFGGKNYGKIDTSKLSKYYELKIEMNLHNKILREDSIENQLATSHYVYESTNQFRLKNLLSIKDKSQFVDAEIKSINNTFRKLKSLLNECKK